MEKDLFKNFNEFWERWEKEHKSNNNDYITINTTPWRNFPEYIRIKKSEIISLDKALFLIDGKYEKYNKVTVVLKSGKEITGQLC